MMRRACGLGVVLGGLYACAALVCVGCAPPPVAMDEAVLTEVETAAVVPEQPSEPVAAEELTEPSGDVLQIREFKIIDDNGQQGVFAKLSRAPRNVSHFTRTNPNRLIIELTGETPQELSTAEYPVSNPLIEHVRVGSHKGNIRLTIMLRGSTFPRYTVDDLHDTLVAFLDEPRGTTEPVREQIVFTQRALPGAVPAPHAVPAPAVVAEPSVAEPSVAPPPAVVAVTPPTAPRAAPVPRPPSVVARAPQPPPVVVTESADPGLPGGAKLYYGRPISLDLKEADIHNVIRLLAGVSELNIVATDDVRGKITLRLSEVPWDQALDIVLQVMNLESIQQGNVVRISTVKRLREEREELHRAQQAAQVVELLHIAYMRVNYAKARKLGDLISGAGRSGQGGRRGKRGKGGEQEGVLSPRGSVLVDEFTNTLIVRDIRRGIRNARELVRRLDIQIPQVLIESRIVEATTDFARQLGVQWGYRASIGPQTGTSTGASFPGTIGFGGSGLRSGSGGVPFLVDFPATGNFAPGTGSVLDLALGSLDGSQALDARLTALEQKGEGRIISRPRVVTLNNVAATIKSLTIIRVRLPSTGTIISTGAGGSAGASQSATEKIETGITLKVTPQVSSDGFVLLDMFAKSSQADFTRVVDNIPTEITREATSHVLIRDGQTVVIGGIYRDTLTDNRAGVPFFNRLPGFRWLFHNESRSKRREDLLVFLTPRIISATKQVGGLPSAAELWERRGGKEPG